MKRIVLASVLVAGGLLVSAGRAAATTVDTPPLHIAGPTFQNTVGSRCMILNLYKKPIRVDTAVIVDEDGNIAASTLGVVDVPVLRAAVLVETNSAHEAFCRVSGRFPKRHVQVTLCAVDTNTNPGACLVMVTAP
jgi:hypothetical protein